VCVYSLSYRACNVHAPYCHLWPVRLYHIFFTLSHKRHVFREKVLDTKCLFWFSPQPLSETFLIVRKTERAVIVNVLSTGVNCNALHSCQILMELKFSRQIWGRTQIPDITQIPPVGTELFDTDKRTDVTEVTVIFRISANAPKNNDNILCHVINDA